MKKSLLALAASGALLFNSSAYADFAEEIRDQINSNKNQVENAMSGVSDNLTAIFAHRGLAPADTLGGGLFGLELGVDATMTDLDQTYLSVVAGTNSEFDMDTVVLPKFSAAIGFPVVPLDLAVTYLPEIEGFSYMSAQAKYALIEGGTVMPALSLAASYSQASLEDAIDVTTMGADLAISKGFGIGIKAVPYAGIGYIKGETSLSNEVVDNTDIKQDYDTSETKLFAGVSFQLALLNIVVEADKIGDYQSQSIKLGLRF